jgi:hypothetical protein
MSRLTASPSAGQSEVLETLRYQGALSSGVQLFRLGPMVSNRYQGDEDREGSDTQFEADVVTVLAALQTAGYVVGHVDLTGAVVDLTAGTPPGSTRIVLTPAGRADARHPMPRPRRLN